MGSLREKQRHLRPDHSFVRPRIILVARSRRSSARQADECYPAAGNQSASRIFHSFVNCWNQGICPEPNHWLHSIRQPCLWDLLGPGSICYTLGKKRQNIGASKDSFPVLPCAGSSWPARRQSLHTGELLPCDSRCFLVAYNVPVHIRKPIEIRRTRMRNAV